MASGRSCHGIAERVHAGKEDIQKYDSKSGGHRGKTAASRVSTGYLSRNDTCPMRVGLYGIKVRVFSQRQRM
jgi:hypothetical protein